MIDEQKNFIDFFMEIGVLYRKMQFILNKKLTHNNISLNELQTIILYFLQQSSRTAENISEDGYFMISNVIFNVMSLEESNFIIDENTALDKKFKSPIKLSKKGEEVIEKINKITKNIPVEDHFYGILDKYNKTLETYL